MAYTSPQRLEFGARAARHGALHFFHPIDLPPWDFLNEARSPWRDPVSGAVQNESFHDLFDRAVAESRAVLACLTDRTADWEGLLGNGSLNLPGSEGENQGPQFSRPWDFATLYDREVQARLRGPEPL